LGKQEFYLFRKKYNLPTKYCKPEEIIPNGASNVTMKQKMVHMLPIPFTQITPINHNDVLLSKIVHGKDLS
jgi:hypothetical protein